MWDFETDPPEYQKKLDWVEEFMQDKLEPLDFAPPLDPYEKTNPQVLRVLRPLQQAVREQGCGRRT